MSKRSHGKPMWWVRPMDGMEIREDEGHFFTGYTAEMVEHIGALHRETGRQHAATDVSCVKQADPRPSDSKAGGPNPSADTRPARRLI